MITHLTNLLYRVFCKRKRLFGFHSSVYAYGIVSRGCAFFMKNCSSCQSENDDAAVKCQHCGIYLKNPRFNFFNFDYDYFFTNLLGKRLTFKGILKAVTVWFLIMAVLAGIGLLIVPWVIGFGKLLGPDFDPDDVTRGLPPWVVIGSILGLLLWIYVCNSVKINDAAYAFREWLAQKFGPKA